MAVADNKRAQAVINLLRQRVTQPIADANAVAGLIRQAIIDDGLIGQFTGAELSALQSFVTDLSALAASSVVAAIESRYMPGHGIKSLVISGVND